MAHKLHNCTATAPEPYRSIKVEIPYIAVCVTLGLSLLVWVASISFLSDENNEKLWGSGSFDIDAGFYNA